MSGSQLNEPCSRSENVVTLTNSTVEINPCVPESTLKAIHFFTGKGATLMVLIPTANQGKINLIKDFFHARMVSGEETRIVNFEIVVADSEVGEQPYDNAGCEGAGNRIRNAVQKFAKDNKKLEELQSKRVGQLYVVAIENFIWMNDLESIPTNEKVSKAVDFGVVAIHDVGSRETVACMSNGVTISKSFIDAARKEGFEDEAQMHGKVTVGQCIAARYAGVDKANWHEKLAGESRYALLKEALSSLTPPERQIKSES